MNISALLYGDADQVAAELSGDNPPTETAQLRAALANALNRIDLLERQVAKLREQDD